jgi:hypothetical protein
MEVVQEKHRDLQDTLVDILVQQDTLVDILVLQLAY